jgi:hypothetical protein
VNVHREVGAERGQVRQQPGPGSRRDFLGAQGDQLPSG